MRARAGVVAVAAAVTVAGCGGAGGRVCTAEARPGLVVTVTDASTKQPICDATVTGTRSDGMVVTIQPLPFPTPSCEYIQYESIGTWSVTASAPGHASATKSDLVVPGDGCHAIETPVAIELAPQ